MLGRGMHAVVLLKQILDWELPPSKFRIDPETKRPPDGLGPTLLGPFEQNALELALQLRDAGVVDRLTALVVGAADSTDSLRKALAVRADEAVHVEVDPAEALDPSQTAELLLAAIRRLDAAELVLAGRQAGDWDHGQVGYLVAERLGWPAVGLVWHAEYSDGRLLVRRSGNGADDHLAVRLPAVLTVTSHPSLQLRMGSVLDRMSANKKVITRWAPDELGLAPAQIAAARRIELTKVWVPEVKRECELIEGEDAATVAARLLGRLEELKLLTRSA
jgi:electron transfer flavoprotein beta subunit